ncbi:MAG: hypothetical protein ACSHYB_08615 [Roseibacillus sp.]
MGLVARSWVETSAGSEGQVSFLSWWQERKEGQILTPGVVQAESEYKEAAVELGKGRSHETFPFLWATEGFQERSEKRRKFHESNAEMTGSSYLHLLHCQLRDFLRNREVVYLDTFYWTKMRDAVLGKGETRFLSLFEQLQSLVESGRIICPLSHSLFEELMRQSDTVTRMATAKLMDALSAGVCLRAPDELIEVEIRRQIYRSIKPEVKDAWTEWIWTKVGFLFGEQLPINEDMSDEDNDYVQKNYIDYMWYERNLVEFLEALQHEQFPLPDNEAYAAATNVDFGQVRSNNMGKEAIRHQEAGFVWHSHYFKTFKRVVQEIWEAEKQACQEYAAKAENQSQPKPNPNVLPNLHILATLSTYFASDKRKVVRPTDIPDMEHAAFALPYCDVYTCDRAMGHAIQQPPHRLERTFKTKVCDRVEELLQHLDTL